MIVWIGSLYRGAVASLYTFLLQVSLGSYDSVFSNIYDTLYALIAIYMIFRMAISLLQYLIDPDKISDKQIGGGKLVVRIVTSILLVISLNSLIFPNLRRISSALVGDGGLVNILFNNIKVKNANGNNITPGNIFQPGIVYSDDTNENNNDLKPNENFTSGFIENVYAAQKTKTDDECAKIDKDIPNLQSFFSTYSGCSKSFIESELSTFMKSYTNHYPTWDKENQENKTRAFFPNQCGNGITYNCYNIVYVEKNNNDYDFSTVIGYDTSKTMEARNQITQVQDTDYIDSYFLLYSSSEDMSTDHSYSGSCTASNDGSMPVCQAATIYITSTPEPTKEEYTCYYAIRKEDSKYIKEKDVAGSNGSSYTTCIDDLKQKMAYISITFSTNNNEDFKKISLPWFDTSKWSFKFGNFNNVDYSGKINKKNEVETILNNGECPYISGISCDDNNNCTVTNNNVVTFTPQDNNNPPKLLQGQKTPSEAISKAYEEISSTICPNDPANGGSGTGQPSTGETEGGDSCSWNNKHEIKIYSPDGEYTTQSVGSAQFAHNLAVAFISPGEDECAEGSSCYQKVGCFTNSYGADTKVGKLNSNGDISFDVIMALLGALVTIGFLIILSLDMIVRQLKLILLQIISPIPALSYINPNDKIFGQWVKYYLSTYADLFIKLLGLQAAFWLAPMMISVLSTNGISTFLIYIGAFLFAKVLPDMISKIFGLDVSGGTFKDAAGIVKNVAKTGAGIAAGATLGAAAGAITGGFGPGSSDGTAAWSAITGAFRGGVSGAKGHILQGAAEQRKRTVQTRQSNAGGGTWWGRADATVARFFGQNDAYEEAKSINDASSSAISQGNEFATAAQTEMSKISDLSHLSELKVAVDRARRGENIAKDITYLDTKGTVKTLYAGSSVDEANKALATAKKSSNQMYANFLKTGKMTIAGSDVTADYTIKSGMGWNSYDIRTINKKIGDALHAPAYETNKAMLENVDKQAYDAGLSTAYSDNIDDGNNVLAGIKQTSARDMTANKANHESAQQNH